MKTYIWNEKPIVNILNIIGSCIIINAIVTFLIIYAPILYFVFDISQNIIIVIGFIHFFFSAIIALILTAIAMKYSTYKKFTDEFIEKIKCEIESAITLKQFKTIYDKLINETVDKNGHCRLARDRDLVAISKDIRSKMEILRKLDKLKNE
jgi:hypothetical protein